jgi:hypothetical protein
VLHPPTCRSLGAIPPSTAAREAPTAPPSKASARDSSILKFSAVLRARPPHTTTLQGAQRAHSVCPCRTLLTIWSEIPVSLCIVEAGSLAVQFACLANCVHPPLTSQTPAQASHSWCCVPRPTEKHLGQGQGQAALGAAAAPMCLSGNPSQVAGIGRHRAADDLGNACGADREC